jgi:O-antigen ligase
MVRAYVPEQLAWYGMVLLLPFGVVAGLRRDRTLTMMLVAHAAVAIVIVALTSGNVGTLIRHRSLVLLYLIWLSVMGAYDLIQRMLDREGGGVHGDR